jgi:hypothetical protein
MPLADIAEFKPDVLLQKYAGTAFLHSFSANCESFAL